jgi:hypothetical protein
VKSSSWSADHAATVLLLVRLRTREGGQSKPAARCATGRSAPRIFFRLRKCERCYPNLSSKPMSEPTDEDFDIVSLHHGDDAWHSGPGWYAVIVDYPDEGSYFFGAQRPSESELRELRMSEANVE